MELVPILRLAWRRRIALGLGVVVSVALALVLARGEAPSTGVASTRLVLDTPVSQLVEAAPKGADSLGWRTELLSDLMTTAPVRRQIASSAGMPLAQLAVINPVLNNPVLPTTLPRRASKIAAGATEPYVLTVLADGTLPVLSIQGRAPTVAAAARLVSAATATLKTATALPPEVPGTQVFVVQDAGRILVEKKSGGGRTKRATAAFGGVLALWWSAVLIGPVALTRLRPRSRRARLA